MPASTGETSVAGAVSSMPSELTGSREAGCVLSPAITAPLTIAERQTRRGAPRHVRSHAGKNHSAPQGSPSSTQATHHTPLAGACAGQRTSSSGPAFFSINDRMPTRVHATPRCHQRIRQRSDSVAVPRHGSASPTTGGPSRGSSFDVWLRYPSTREHSDRVDRTRRLTLADEGPDIRQMPNALRRTPTIAQAGRRATCRRVHCARCARERTFTYAIVIRRRF
jgi:hypothetical protein